MSILTLPTIPATVDGGLRAARLTRIGMTAAELRRFTPESFAPLTLGERRQLREELAALREWLAGWERAAGEA